MGQLKQVERHATSIYTEGGMTKIIYHNTAVVQFGKGKVILNSDGWETSTTKNRMNRASNQYELGYDVFQKNYRWYVRLRNGEILDFFDGIEFEY